jgi:hypothetical protein
VALVTGGTSGIGLEIAAQLGAVLWGAPRHCLHAFVPHCTTMSTCSAAPRPARGAGLHGAAVAVTGRRQAVLDQACDELQRRGVRTVLGLQVGAVQSHCPCLWVQW